MCLNDPNAATPAVTDAIDPTTAILIGSFEAWRQSYPKSYFRMKRVAL
jgi:hypothetical protein